MEDQVIRHVRMKGEHRRGRRERDRDGGERGPTVGCDPVGGGLAHDDGLAGSVFISEEVDALAGKRDLCPGGPLVLAQPEPEIIILENDVRGARKVVDIIEGVGERRLKELHERTKEKGEENRLRTETVTNRDQDEDPQEK